MHRILIRLLAVLAMTLGVLPLLSAPAHAATTTVTGRLTSEAGQPVTSGVRISIRAEDTYLATLPDANGYYSFPEIPAGQAEVSIYETGNQGVYKDQWLTGQTVNEPPATTTLNYTLPRFQGIVLIAKNSAGTPLENIITSPQYRDPATGTWSFADPADPEWGVNYGGYWTTDAQGRAKIARISGTYRICGEDEYYANGWAPTTRYQTRCYADATTWETATAFTLTTAAPRKVVTVTMPEAGLGLNPGDPWVYGPNRVGAALKVDTGSWLPSGTTLTYKWTRGDTVVGTGTSYTPTSADLGKYICVEVTGAKSGYVTHTQSNCSGGAVGDPDPTMASPFVITGSGAVGSTLTASHGTFTPAQSDEYVTWLANGREIAGAWGETTLQLTSDLAGKRITARLQAYGSATPGYNNVHAFASGPVVGAFTAAPVPTISGTRAVGYTLTANPGTWSPTPDSFSYQWYRVSSTGTTSTITGATAKTYALTASDRGYTVKVRVTARKTGYTATGRTSATTGTILSSFTTKPTPTVSGTKAVGSTLTVTTGTWSPTPDSFRFQWYRNGVAIPGATAKTYKLTAADQGQSVKARVTAVKAGYVSTSKYSASYTIS